MVVNFLPSLCCRLLLAAAVAIDVSHSHIAMIFYIVVVCRTCACRIYPITWVTVVSFHFCRQIALFLPSNDRNLTASYTHTHTNFPAFQQWADFTNGFTSFHIFLRDFILKFLQRNNHSFRMLSPILHVSCGRRGVACHQHNSNEATRETTTNYNKNKKKCIYQTNLMGI